jgi:putative colanic acid biosynthesis UDP-glucose lipid carrier transferase
MMFADGLLIIMAALLAYAVRSSSGDIEGSGIFFYIVTITVLLTSIYFQHMGLYKIPKIDGISTYLYRTVLGYSSVAITLIVLDYLLKISGEISRAWSIMWFVFALAFLVLIRLGVARWIGALSRAGRFATSVAIVGTPDSVRHLIARLTPQLGKTIDLVEVFDAGDDCFSAFQELARTSRTQCIDEVLIPLPWAHSVPLEELLRPLRNLPIAVRLIPEIPQAAFSCLSLGEQSGVPTISVLERPLNDLQAAIKRAEDLILASIVLVFVGPLMLFIAFLIKVDSPGPVLFRQERWGLNAKKIWVLKFRTMRVTSCAEKTVLQATRDDKRITRIGKFLRRSSLDELPQLFNVLSGEMSLVGPRPHAVAHNEHYMMLIDNYLGRHKVKPGITGLAQVNGYRGITDTLDKMENRVKYDLEYIDRWSLALDLKVIVKTAFVGFVGKNAF